MRHGYDLFGWYTGLAPEATKRSTPLAPANASTSRVPGDIVANWSGREWVDRLYFTPPDVAERRTFQEMQRAALKQIDVQFAELAADRFGEEAGPSVIAVLPLIFDLWRSIDNAARSPNAGMTWLLAARTTRSDARSAVKAATNRQQINDVFPIGWPA